jgi:hypothetical protein
VRTPAKVTFNDMVPHKGKAVYIPTVIFDMMDSLPEELLDSYGEEMNCADVGFIEVLTARLRAKYESELWWVK